MLGVDFEVSFVFVYVCVMRIYGGVLSDVYMYVILGS